MTRPFPKVDCERLHPGLPVKDVAAAVEFYTTRLGFTHGFTWPEDGPPTMAAVTLGDVQILLHTNDQLGDSGNVPSPHTKAQLRHIQQLKKKHGIDYDSHGSYRFVEKPAT